MESLQYSFETIRVATDNFSETNKLGQGGFGAVYKVKIRVNSLFLVQMRQKLKLNSIKCMQYFLSITFCCNVIQGRLSDGQEIAVKRLSRNSGQGDLEFKNEVMLVAKLQHRNLVRLLGFSLKGNERLLVYGFVQNGSLDHFIFGMVLFLCFCFARKHMSYAYYG